MARLKQTYDGYHFCWPSPDIYNPYSLLHALSGSEISNYWFGTGTPTYLVEMLRKYGVKPEKIEGIHADEDSFDVPTEMLTDTTPLLYQSGYLTINGYDEIDGYLLDIPNNEVRVALAQINERGYADGFTNMGLPPVVKIGINIDPDTRTINDWVIERSKEF